MTSYELHFNPVAPPLVSITILLLSFMFALALELRKKLRFKLLRITALCMVMLSISALILRPSFLVNSSDNIMLLTPGYEREQADSLLNLHPDLILLHDPETRRYGNSTALGSYHHLADYASISYVVGTGLPHHAFDNVNISGYQYIPSGYPEGIIHLSFDNPVIAGRENHMEGVLRNRSGSGKLLLEGPGGIEDSVVFSDEGYHRFSFSFTPKTSGNQLYTFIIKRQGKIIREEFPIHIEKQKQLNILFVHHFPAAESQHLKNFLERNHKLLLRYRVSKNTFRYVAANRKLERLDVLTRPALSTFDLVIIDSDALLALPASEVRALENAIKDGLGLLLVLNDLVSNTQKIRSLLNADFRRISSDTAHVWLSQQIKVFPSWPISIESKAFIHPVTKNNNRILSGYWHSGFGKIGFQLLQETYRMVLQGDTVAYGTLWSPLVEETSRTNKMLFTVRPKNNFPVYENEPVYFDVISSGQAPIVFADNVQVPLAEDILFDDVWHGKIWGGKPGWHTLRFANDSTSFDYFVSQKNMWQSLRIAHTININIIRSERVKVEEKDKIKKLEPVSPLLFYLVLLLGAGMLWLAPKL